MHNVQHDIDTKKRVVTYPALFHHLLVGTIAVFVYWRSLFNGFNVDDDALVILNTAVHGLSWQNFKLLFTSTPNGLEYLPVRDLTYCLDYQLWGLNPFGYHLSNLFYYLLTCLVLYVFLNKLLFRWTTSSPQVALFTTLLYAVHPLHVESVAGIAQRKDLVSGIFCFVSLYLFLRFRETKLKGYYAASLIFFALALLSKSTVIILPLYIALLELTATAVPGKSLGRKILPAIPYGAISVIVPLATYRLLFNVGVVSAGNYQAEGRIATALLAVFYYLKRLLVPYPLYFNHPFTGAATVFRLDVAIAFVALIMIVYLLIRYRRDNPIVCFGGFFFLASLPPVIGLIPASTLVADRYAFLPSVGFCLVLGWVLAAIQAAKRSAATAAAVMLIGVLMIFSAISYDRIRDWKDYPTLMISDIRHFPKRPRLYMLVGKYYFTKGDYRTAFEYLEQARNLNPAYNLDYALFASMQAVAENRFMDALHQLDQITVPIKGDIMDFNYQYGYIHERMGNYETAREYYRKALNSKERLYVMRINLDTIKNLLGGK
ncbi:MAG: tetratricopeptide repeat protein [Geobacter sp.]|nr:tetratricopeptide repeat protein [Geobacter sp.]